MSRSQTRGAVQATSQGEEIAILERVIAPRHVRLKFPVRQIAGHAQDAAGRPQVVELLLLVRQPGHARDLILELLPLDAVQQRRLDTLSRAQAVP